MKNMKTNSMTYLEKLLANGEYKNSKYYFENVLGKKEIETVIYNPTQVLQEQNANKMKMGMLLFRGWRIKKIVVTTGIILKNGRELFMEDEVKFKIDGVEYKGTIGKEDRLIVKCNDKTFTLKDIIQYICL